MSGKICWVIFFLIISFFLGMICERIIIAKDVIEVACEKKYKLHKDFILCLEKTGINDLTVAFKKGSDK